MDVFNSHHHKKSYHPDFYAEWKSICSHWVDIHKRYIDEFNYDCAYKYTERTNVGYFLTAAHLSGFATLQEYQWGKIDQKKKPYKGYVDLWIGSKEKQIDIAIEAKQKAIDINRKSNESKIDDILYTAMCDAKRTLAIQKKYLGMSLVFLPVRSIQDVTDEDISKTIECIKSRSVDFVSWFFPHKFRKPYRQGKKFYPGIIMAATLISEA